MRELKIINQIVRQNFHSKILIVNIFKNRNYQNDIKDYKKKTNTRVSSFTYTVKETYQPLKEILSCMKTLLVI